MESTAVFNGLNGTAVTRANIIHLIEKAKNEEQFILVNRLQKVLDQNDDEKLIFEIEKPAIEQVPESLIDTAIFLDDINEENGLNKAVTQNEIYNSITDLIINTIKKVGHLPWQKEWHGSGADGVARNYVTKKPYSGINHILLNFDIKYDENDEPYLVPVKFIQPYYLTFNQIKETKATLKKGSKARNVIYYSPLYTFNNNKIEISTSDVEKWKKFIKDNGLTELDLKQFAITIPIVKYYNVFKADDCDGLKFPKPIENKNVDPIEQAQTLIDGYPNPPKFTFIGSEAAYYPLSDKINMPKIQAFTQESFYYSTFFHELIHSTGHSKRLNRENDTRKRDGSIEDKKAYAFEELVAELGAVFLCSESGILFHTLENSAKYLKGWNNKLIDQLQDDNRFFFKASAAAQKSAAFIINENGEKVEKKVEKVVEKKVKKPVEKEIEKPVEDQPKLENNYLFSKEEIPYEIAKRAHQGTSFDPEKRAISEQNNYFSTLKEVYEKYFEVAKNKNLVDEFKSLFNRFHLKYKDYKIAELQSRSRVLSTMITGGANFPTARNQKNSRFFENKQKETWNHIEKYEKYFTTLLYPEKQPIKSGKSDTLSKLEEKLISLQNSQERMVKANAEIRKLTKKGLSPAEVIKEYEIYLENNGFSKDNIQKIVGLAKRENRLMWLPFNTTNSGAEIRRTKERIETEKKLKTKHEETGNASYKFDGGTVVLNYNENRVQILFDAIPDSDLRSKLKSSGNAFKWSPFNKAWQRQLNTYRLSNLQSILPGLDISSKTTEKKNEVAEPAVKETPKVKTERLEKVNPKPFAVKPKSVSVSTAIKDVLSLPKYKNTSPLAASLLYKNFKNETGSDLYLEIEIVSEYEKAILKKESELHTFFEYLDEVQLTAKGVDFINAVNGRLDSLRNQKSNFAMFDGLNGQKKSKNQPKKTTKKTTVYKKETTNTTNLNPDFTKKQGLKQPFPATNEVHVPVTATNQNSLAYKLKNRNKEVDYYEIDNPQIAAFLGKIEIKTKESVAITLTGGQGSMKTRFCFQLMNALAQKYKVGHASIEEHPESSLYFDKVDQYLNDVAIQNISNPEINSIDDVHKLVAENDVIIIDSFSKLQELDKNCELDKDFRKKYDGKLFIVIYQTTVDGKMRGGSKSQFDGDIILFIEKFANYEENYVYPDKNRYQKKSLDQLKYNIFHQSLITDDEAEQQPEIEQKPINNEPVNFSFEVN